MKSIEQYIYKEYRKMADNIQSDDINIVGYIIDKIDEWNKNLANKIKNSSLNTYQKNNAYLLLDAYYDTLMVYALNQFKLIDFEDEA